MALMAPTGLLPIAYCGILVGGASRRMGGRPKGLLATPDGPTILERTMRLAREFVGEVLLLGSGTTYDGLGLRRLPDAAEGAGPLAGVVSLLEHARSGNVIVVSCDLPFLSRDLWKRLVTHAPGAGAVAPYEDGKWNGTFARYRAEHALAWARSFLAKGGRSLQALLAHVDAAQLPLSLRDRDSLRDWDCPEDMR